MIELLNRPKNRKGISLSVNPKPSNHYQNSIINHLSTSKISQSNQGQCQIFIPFNSIPSINIHKTVPKRQQVSPIIFNQRSPRSTQRLNSSVFVYETSHNSYRQIQRQNKYYLQKNRNPKSNILLEKPIIKPKQYNQPQKKKSFGLAQTPVKIQSSHKHQYTFEQRSQSESPNKNQRQHSRPLIQRNNSKGLMSDCQNRQNYHVKQERTFNDYINNEEHKQNIQVKKQQRQLDIGKIQLIESKLLDIIRVCQHGL